MVSFDPKNEASKAFPFKKIVVFPFEKFSGAMNMALDFYLAQQIGGEDAPVLRFYGWEPFCLSLGYHQNPEFVDFKAVKKKGYHVVRRPTGGSAILHSEELTYGLIVPFTAGVNNHHVYYLFHRLLVNALNNLGVAVELNYIEDKENYLRDGKKRFACFNRPAFTEIKFQNKKVVGSAQKLYKNAILQHGSILLGPKQNEIIHLMNADFRTKERYLQILKKSSLSLSEINERGKQIKVNQLKEALLQEFEKELKIQIVYRCFTDREINEAQKFVDRFQIQ